MVIELELDVILLSIKAVREEDFFSIKGWNIEHEKSFSNVLRNVIQRSVFHIECLRSKL